jgi:hypothetical protein
MMPAIISFSVVFIRAIASDSERPSMGRQNMIRTSVLALECPWAIGARRRVHHYVRDSENKVRTGVSDGCASVGNRER